MATITTRAGKGSPLTNTEVDNNFTNLNTDKAEVGANSDITSLSGITGGVSEADYVDFDIDATSSRNTGRMRWNSNDRTLEVDMIGSNVTMQIGQELPFAVYNNSGSDLANGEVVYFSGAANGNVAVKKFIADGSIDYEYPIAITTEAIADGQIGYAVTYGLVRGIDTSAYSVGAALYASADTAGALRLGHPPSPAFPVHIGTVVASNATEGVIFTDVWNHTPADESVYDNSDSTLVASNVKGAIDELDLKKADTSILQANVNLYPTTASNPDVSGYNHLVNNITDADFDDTAVNVSTGELTTTSDVLIASLASDAGVFEGDIGGTNVTLIGNIRQTAGNDDGRFKFEVYHRTDGGTETLIGTSGYTDAVSSTNYVQFFASTFLSSQTFTETDRIVMKFYGKLDNAGSGTFDFQFGGSEPVRALFPVSVNVIPISADADAVVVDTSNFTGSLSGADTTVQAALETLDGLNLTIAGVTGLSDALDAKANSVDLGALATLDSVNASTIIDDSVGAAELNVTGNGTTTQFLRSDGDGSFSWAVPVDTDTTYTAGSGLSLSSTEFSHGDTSSVADVDNSNGTVLQDITFDTYGHVQTVGSVNLDDRYYTETETDAKYVYVDGDTMEGPFANKQTAISVTAASTVVDFSQGNNFVITMGANTSFLFQNMVAGQSGILYIIQDATGGWQFTLPAIAKTPKNGGNIAQETGADVVSIISYTVLNTSNVLVNYIGDFA